MSSTFVFLSSSLCGCLAVPRWRLFFSCSVAWLDPGCGRWINSWWRPRTPVLAALLSVFMALYPRVVAAATNFRSLSLPRAVRGPSLPQASCCHNPLVTAATSILRVAAAASFGVPLPQVLTSHCHKRPASPHCHKPWWSVATSLADPQLETFVERCRVMILAEVFCGIGFGLTSLPSCSSLS